MSIDHNRIKVSDLETNQPNKILITNDLGQLEFREINNIKIDSYNALDYTDAGKSLDARQGKVLKDLIDNINILLASDNLNLNTLQKLVDAIELVQNSLSSLLVNDLTTGGTTKALTAEMGKQLQNNKVDKVVGKNLLSDTEIARLATLSNYTHPANHPPGIILQDLNNRFVTDVEKVKWNSKADLLSPVLTGVPTAPTAAIGTNTTQLATTAFVQASTSNLSGIVLTSTDQSISGVKNFIKTTSGYASIVANNTLGGNSIELNNSTNGNSISSINTSNGAGIAMANTGIGQALNINNSSSGSGGFINNSNNGTGLQVINSAGSGDAISVNGMSSSTGFLFVGKNAGVNTFTVNRTGDIVGTSYTGGANLTGIPTAPTAAAGTNTTQVATTAFVLANSSITPDATTTLKGKIKLAGDLGGTADLPTTPTAIHVTGNESWSGIKSSINNGTTQTNGILLTNGGTGDSASLVSRVTQTGFGLLIYNQGGGVGTPLGAGAGPAGIGISQSNTGSGMLINNSANGIGLQIYNTSSGRGFSITTSSNGPGIFASNTTGSTGISIYSSVLGSGNGIVSNVDGGGTGLAFVGQSVGANTFTVNKLGDIVANSYTGKATLTGIPTAPTAATGTNTTQIATTAFVAANSRPYKSYVGLVNLSQSPTVGPTIENTIGSIAWSRNSLGMYYGTLAGAFTNSKTDVLVTKYTASGTQVPAVGQVVDLNNIAIRTTNTSGSPIEANDTYRVEIRVYN
ncbi:hypothetical protein [Flavobacterium sp. JAS]|uniref:beta strand repeat-containing protein n=1 Tax=Flavobacterium sp. JAS TaxID=2897329 RepID=UPI001E431109|nr:hypothetical protein [Flavobacterium sp. JAS]MCD0470495.1 hypothetical protein [Flavobacterium sp. JAS]